jgi:hypothetical protein
MMLDRRAFKDGAMPPRTAREYLSMHNSLLKTLAASSR